MARNEEKAMTLWNKWQTFKTEFHSVGSNRRPLVAANCDSLGDAEKWRREILRDLTKKTAMIQNATLGEFKIRDLNDEINKLMKQKHFWEIRIRELGGSDLKRSGKLFYEVDGKELPGQPGYRYYGAAKDLPGIRELFAEGAVEIEGRKKRKRMRGDLHRYITPDYFGYRDDDDGVLATREAVVEAEKIAEAVKKFRDTEKSTGAISVDMNVTSAMERRLHEEDEEDFRLFLEHHLSSSTTAADGNNTAVAVEALSQGPEKKQVELESALLEERKSSLLSMLL